MSKTICYNVNYKVTLNFNQFKILKRCHSKFECSQYEMCFIKNLKPSLMSSQSPSKQNFLSDHFISVIKCFGNNTLFNFLYS